MLAGIFPIMAGLTSVLCSGLLDRYKNLKFAFLEGGISWVPAHVERMDDHFENPRYGAKDLHQPSAQRLSEDRQDFLRLRRQRIVPAEDRRGSRRRSLSCFRPTIPHADRTEGTASVLKERSDIATPVRQKLLEDNARHFYGL